MKKIPRTRYQEESVKKKIELMKIWWEGPDFLHRNTSIHPFQHKNNYTNMPEARVISLTAQNIARPDPSIIERFSSLTRLKRVLAYCLRFKNNLLNPITRTKEPLTVQDTDEALTLAIKICQANEFYQELHSLRAQKPLNPKSKILNLHPFIDLNGII